MRWFNEALIAMLGSAVAISAAAQAVDLDELEARLKREQAAEDARRAEANRTAEASRRASATQGTLVVETDSACELRIDGEAKTALKPGVVSSVQVAAGEQLIDCVSSEFPDVKVREVREVRAGSKLVLTLSLAAEVRQRLDRSAAASSALQIDRENETHKVSWMVGKQTADALKKIAILIDGGSVFAGIEDKIHARPLRMSATDAASARTEFAVLAKTSTEQPVHWSSIPDSGSDFVHPASRKFGYMVGLDIGASLYQIKSEIDLTIVRNALIDSLAGSTPLFGAHEEADIRKRFTERLQARRTAEQSELAARNRTEGDAFLARNKTAPGVVVLPSGLQYLVLKLGSGPKPRASDTVEVHYTGTLLNGTKFDSSVDRGQPAQFPLNGVIPGWTEGLQLMPAGSKYRFWIPSSLAYGDQGTPGPIGPNATLIFDVELLSIK